MDANKHEKICEAYWGIRSRVREDPEYARLYAGLEALEPRYEAVLENLPIADREVIDCYIRFRESMASRLLEYACGELLPGP